jgi:hypothetical protein
VEVVGYSRTGIQCTDSCMSIRQFLLYVTNNEDVSRHETGFDIAFFIINTVALVGGGAYLAYYGMWEWVPFLLIEYTWAIDTIRHNR